MTAQRRERIEELLADRALWGLDPGEERELERLLAEEPGATDAADRADAESAAAATALELAGEWDAAVPPDVVRAVQADAAKFVVEHHGVPLASLSRGQDSDRPGPAASSTWMRVLPFAALVLALLYVWFDAFRRVSPRESRAALLAKTATLLRIDWKPGPSELSGTPAGDVVWSGADQEGYMRLRGLPVNDPGVRQYQLWIFDKERDVQRPVDGGVFDVSSTGEVVVPIRAGVRVHEAFAFAVTVEKPGGVVVSEREHVVATAGLD